MKITLNLIQHNENKHKKKKKPRFPKKSVENADSQFGQMVECSFTN